MEEVIIAGKYVCMKDRGHLISENLENQVFEGFIKDEPTQRVAIKIIQKSVDEKTLKLQNSAINVWKASIETEPSESMESRNVQKVLDVVESEMEVFIILEHCGGNLFDCLHGLKRNPLSDEMKRNFMRQIGQGYKDIYKSKLVHMDIKPKNILLTTEDPNETELKISNFELCKFISDDKQEIDNCAGTPIYMAPELLCGNRSCRNIDLWSLGISFFEIMTGETPFNGPGFVGLIMKMQKEPVVFPQDMPSDIKNLLEGLLQKDPKKRMSFEEFFFHPVIRPVPKRDLDLKDRFEFVMQNSFVVKISLGTNENCELSVLGILMGH